MKKRTILGLASFLVIGMGCIGATDAPEKETSVGTAQSDFIGLDDIMAGITIGGQIVSTARQIVDLFKSSAPSEGPVALERLDRISNQVQVLGTQLDVNSTNEPLALRGGMCCVEWSKGIRCGRKSACELGCAALPSVLAVLCRQQICDRIADCGSDKVCLRWIVC